LPADFHKITYLKEPEDLSEDFNFEIFTGISPELAIQEILKIRYFDV